MPPCHVKPFLRPGVIVAQSDSATQQHDSTPVADSCDYCGSPRLEWRKCKLICLDCRQINKSCADL